ncbi:MAG: hypothetical protein ABI992_00025 [Chthoniobacterales bacterium]
MNMLPLAWPALYTIIIIGICAYLLIRGLTNSFILWFGAGAIFQAIPRFGYVVLAQSSGGFTANRGWMQAFSAAGILGAVCSVAGFSTLAFYLLRTQPADS